MIKLNALYVEKNIVKKELVHICGVVMELVRILILIKAIWRGLVKVGPIHNTKRKCCRKERSSLSKFKAYKSGCGLMVSRHIWDVDIMRVRFASSGPSFINN